MNMKAAPTPFLCSLTLSCIDAQLHRLPSDAVSTKIPQSSVMFVCFKPSSVGLQIFMCLWLVAGPAKRLTSKKAQAQPAKPPRGLLERHTNQQNPAGDVAGVDVDSLWPTGWDDMAGVSVQQTNNSSSRWGKGRGAGGWQQREEQQQQYETKGAQVRAELLGKGTKAAGGGGSSSWRGGERGRGGGGGAGYQGGSRWGSGGFDDSPFLDEGWNGGSKGWGVQSKASGEIGGLFKQPSFPPKQSRTGAPPLPAAAGYRAGGVPPPPLAALARPGGAGPTTGGGLPPPPLAAVAKAAGVPATGTTAARSVAREPQGQLALVHDGDLLKAALGGNGGLHGNLQQRRGGLLGFRPIGGAGGLAGAGVHGSTRSVSPEEAAGGWGAGGGVKGFQITRAGKRTPGDAIRRQEGGQFVEEVFPRLTMEGVHEEILGWDLLEVVGERGVRAAAARLKGLIVPQRFRSVGQYCHVFRQLLMEELRAEVQSSYEELVGGGGGNRGGVLRGGPVLLAGMQRQSQVWVITCMMDTSQQQQQQQQQGGGFVRGDFDQNWLRQDDLLLLTKVQLVNGSSLEERSLPQTRLLALVVEQPVVEGQGWKKVVMKVVPGSAGAVNPTLQQHWEQLLGMSQMQLYVTQVTSLVPKFREFQVRGGAGSGKCGSGCGCFVHGEDHHQESSKPLVLRGRPQYLIL